MSHGGVDLHSSSIFVRGWLRFSFGVARVLVAVGLTPSAITLLGLLVSVAVPVAVLFDGVGLFVAAGLVLLAAIADSTDGAVALMTARSTRLGAFYDSVADRLSEAGWLLALWIVGVPGWLVVLCGALAWLHEYVRARATVAGMSGIGVITVAERPTRIIAVIAALVLGGMAWRINPHLAPGVITVVVAFWVVLGLLGGVRLLRGARLDLSRPSSSTSPI